MYPYHLGCHLKTHKLCRIPHPDLGCGIPQGFCRVLSYKEKGERYRRFPHDAVTKELHPMYMSIHRWTDIQEQLGEPRTGPNMFQLFISDRDRRNHSCNDTNCKECFEYD